MPLPGSRALQLTDAPHMGLINPGASLFPNMPLDLIIQSALSSSTGRLFHGGVAGRGLLDQIYQS